MGGKGGQTTGYRYYIGLHGGICHGPVDALLEIRGGNITIWSGAQTSSGSIYISAPNAYGGDDREGGVQGTLSVMMGEATQGANSYLQAVIGGLQSAYRGLLTVVYQGGLIASNSPYPKPWSFRVRRTTKGWDSDNPWYSSKAAITLSNGVVGMNPAHIVYETLTNRDWGMGYPTGIIDTATFQASADQLYTEGFGLCLMWLRTDTIENFLQSIMDYIGGVLVQSKTTGLFQLNLIRGNYNIGTLPVLTRDNLVELDSLETTTITGSTNEVVMTWFDPTSKTTKYTAVQALGAIQAQGVIVSANKDYPGIASADLAARVGQRDLRTTSVPLKRLKAKFDRNAFSFLPGDVFVFNFPDEQISSMVFRVGEVDYGTLSQGAISITAIQDVFALPDTSYVVSQTTNWTAPSNTPQPCPYFHGFEATYVECYKNLSSYDLSQLPNTAGYACMLNSRPNGLAQYYEVWTKVLPASFAHHGNDNFCPTGTIQSSVGPFDPSVTLLAGIDLDVVAIPCYGMIQDTKDEIIYITALDPSTGIATIARGCIDTVPSAHAAGARLWLHQQYIGSDQVEYFSGETVDQRALSHTTSGGSLALGLAPDINVTIAGRQALPYPPAYMTVNGTRWDQQTEITGPLALTWRERNRITQQDQMIDNTQATVTPEAGTTYTITLSDGSGTPFYTATSVTGTSWTWPAPDDIHTQVGIKVTAVRSGLSSYQSQVTPAINRVGYGLNYGNDYGSV